MSNTPRGERYGSFVRTVNPATEEEIGQYRLSSFDEALTKLRTAKLTFESKWGPLSIEERSDYLRKLAKSMRDHAADAARTITEEMGKPIAQSEAEVEKCAWAAEIYANNTKEWLSKQVVTTDSKESYVEFQPLGVIFSIMPWNFPFWQTCRSIIPSIVVGNTTVLRHSNQVPGCSTKLEEIFHDAGFPDGVFCSVVSNHEVVLRLIESSLIEGVSFSGSIESGKKIGEAAGRNLKKAVLELGGSDPFIVLDDADIGEAARIGANARLVCCGQSCIAAKRFIVVKQAAAEFVEALTQEFNQKTVGDPMDHEVDVGPLRSQYQVELLENQLEDAFLKGARPTIGGKRKNGGGFFFEPTILEEVEPKMKVMQEEVFGPVAPIYVVENETAAVQTANGTEFGLGASIWTANQEKGRKLAARMQCGVVFVNELVKSDPRMPFGGIKQSGIGRELSRFGLLEFANAKSINLYD
jgi:succinate-semialdehyde dehydrogenase / glutarate-semialdehyde dehydrogenase